MTGQSSKKKVSRAIYIVISVLFLASLIGHEFFWRYASSLNLMIKATLHDNSKIDRTLVIAQKSDSPVDTSRREFKDVRHGETTVYMWLENGHVAPDSTQQIIMLTLRGKYISETRPIHISTDSSSQLLLIPNTIQGLPTGSNKIIYLKNDSVFALLEFNGFINDIDKDGRDEVNIPDCGGWMRLNTQTSEWMPAQLKTTP